MSDSLLWIEDNEVIIEREKGFLGHLFPDDRFVIVRSYDEAVQALKERRPFLAGISDLFYSGRDDAGQINRKGAGGSDFLEYVRSNQIDMPVVMWGSYSPPAIEEELNKRGLRPDEIFSKGSSHLVDIVAALKQIYGKEPQPERRKTRGAGYEIKPPKFYIWNSSPR